MESDFRSIEFIPGPTQNRLVVGGLTGVYEMDLAASGVWTEFGVGVPTVQVRELVYDAADDLLVAGTMGRGAFTFADASTGGTVLLTAGLQDGVFSLRTVDSTLTINGELLTFNGFENVSGGDADDTFNVLNNVFVNINGNGGMDTVNVGAGLTLTGAVTTGDSDDSVVLGDGANITVSGGGTIDLGDGNDSFVFGESATVGDAANSVTIAGNTGSDTLSFSGYTTARDVALTDANVATGFSGTEVAIFGQFTGIDVLGGSTSVAPQSDILRGLAANAATWTINVNETTGEDANSYLDSVSTASLGFTQFEDLRGSSAADTFQFDAFDDQLGTVVGLPRQISISGGTGTDELTGNEHGNTFVVSLLDAGTIGVPGQASNMFSGIENLTGGAGSDSFRFENGGSLTGSINGGTGADALTGDDDGNVFTINAVNAGLLTDKLTDFSNIERVNGGERADTFNINAALSGDGVGTGVPKSIAVDGGLEDDTITVATGVVMLGGITGGDDDDQINIGAGAGTTTVFGGVGGGAGDDTVTLTGSVTTDVAGEAGEDVLRLATGAVVTGAFDGGTGSDTLEGGDTASTYIINGVDSGSISSRLSSFTNVENLQGGTAADIFHFQSGGTLTNGTIDGGTGGGDIIRGDGNANLFLVTGTVTGEYTSILGAGTVAFSDIEGLDGSSGSDTFTFDDLGFLTEALAGGLGDDILVGAADGDVFHVTGTANAGVLYDLDPAAPPTKAGPRMTGFTGIENLVGQGDDDYFDVDADLSGDIEGGGGVNTLDLAPNVVIGGNVSNVDVTLTIDGEDTGAADPDDFIVVRTDLSGALEVLIDLVSNTFFLPGAGIEIALTVNGLGGDDTLVVDYSNGSGIGYFDADITFVGGVVNGENNVLQVIADDAAGALNEADYIPDAGSATDGVVTTRQTAGGDENTIIFQNLTPVELNGFTNVLFQTPLAQDVINLTAQSAPVSGDPALQVSGTSNTTAFETLFLANVSNVLVDLATGDILADSDDTVTIGDGALRANAALASLTVTTSGGDDTIRLEESDYRNDSNANVLTIDAGAGDDTLQIAPATDSGLIQLSNGAVSLGSDPLAAADLGTVTLTGFAGEVADIDGTGAAVDTRFDLSGWLNGGTADINGGGGDDTLAGPNEDATWDVQTDTSGTVNNFTYSNIANLIGATGNDTFEIAAAVGAVNSIDGGTGTNAIDFSDEATTAIAVVLTANSANGFDGTAAGKLVDGFSNIGSVTGTTAAAADSLTGQDGVGLAANWSIGDVSDSYTFNGVTLAFGSIESLIGGTTNDTFDVQTTRILQISDGEGDDAVSVGGDDVLTVGGAGTIDLGEGNDAVTLSVGSQLAGSVLGGLGDDSLTLAASSTLTGTFDGGADVDTVDYSGISNDLTVTLTGLSGTPTDGFTGTDGVTGGFLGIDALVAGSGTDTLVGQSIDDARWTVNGTGLYRELSANLEAVNFSGFEQLQGGTTDDDFRLSATTAGITAIDGAGGSDRIEGSTLADTFNITSLNAGNVNLDTATPGATISFQSIEALDANDGDDRFVLGLNGRVSNVLDGGGDSDTISAPNLANTFVVNADNGGTLANATGTLGFADVENLEGNSGVDSFTVNAGFTLGGSVTAGAGADVVTLEAGAEVTGNVSLDGNDDTMTLNGGSLVGGTVTGGTGNETFTLTGAGTVSATIDGEAGTDQFDLAAGVMVNGALTGGADVDILTTDGSAATTFVIDQADSGTLSNRGGARFSTIEDIQAGDGVADSFRFETGGSLDQATLDGGTGAGDSLVGTTAADQFLVDGTNSGSATIGGGTTSFVEVESLNARRGDDTFTFTTTGLLAGALDGGDDNDLLIGSNSGDVFLVSTPNAGSLFAGPGQTNPRTQAGFTSIENLTGGTGDDEFIVNADLDGNVDGGAGNNTLVLDVVNASIGGTVSNVSVTPIISGTAGDDVIIVRRNGSNQIEIDLNSVVRTLFVPATQVDVNLVVDVSATAGSDLLIIDYSAGSLPIDVTYTGNGTDDRLQVIGSGAEAATYTPDATTAGTGVIDVDANVISVAGLETVVADDATIELSGLGSVSVVTPNSADNVILETVVAAVSGQQGLRVSGTSGAVTFDAVSLVDVPSVTIDMATEDEAGSSADTFTLAAGASLSAYASLANVAVSTGAGADTVNILANDLRTISGGTNVLSLDAGSGTDQLNVTTNEALVVLTDSQVSLGTDPAVAANLGSVGLVNIAGEVASLTGGAGNTTFDLSDWQNGSSAQATIDGGTGSDTLVGPNRASAATVVNWDIDGANTGTVATFDFSNIENLTGGNASDRFLFMDGATVSGQIDGGAGTVNTLDLDQYTTVTNITLTAVSTSSGFDGTNDAPTPAVSGFANISGINAGTAGGELRGQVLNGGSVAQAGTFNLQSLNSTFTVGAVSLTFNGFTDLTGGAVGDIFSVNADSTVDITGADGDDSINIAQDVLLTGTVNAGAGADTVSLAVGAEIDGAVSGGNDSDRFVFGDTAVVTGLIAGGADADTLSFQGYTSARSITLTGQTIDGFTGTDASGSAAGGFSGIDSLEGSLSTGDSLTGIDNAANPVTWTIGTNSTYEDTASGRTLGFTGFESLAGGQAEDTFQFADNSVIAVAISGGAGNDVAVANANGTDFTVNLTDAGTALTRSGVASATSTFEGIESLSGASGDDVFAFTNFGSLSGSIDGSGGTDRVTGDDNGNVFTVSSPNEGTLHETDGTTLKVTGGFSNVEQLFGGLGADVFNVNDSLSGDGTSTGVPSSVAINAGAGQDTVTVADDVTMAGGIETGSEVDVVTIGDQVNIVGGIGLGSGNDSIQFNGVASTNVSAGLGNDQINLATAAVVTGTLDGGVGSDTISTGDIATTFVIDEVDSGAITGRASGFQRVENLVAGSMADVFRFQDTGALTNGSIDGGAGIDRIEGDGDANRFVISGTDSGTYFAAVAVNSSASFTDVESLDGRSGDDVFEFTTGGFLTDSLDGGAGSDELIGSDNGDVFDVTGNNSGVLYDGAGLTNPRTGGAGFVSVENLTGGAGVDNFTVRAGVTIDGSLDGAGGNDSFTLENNSTVGGDLAGGTGTNTLILNPGAQILGNVSDVNVDISVAGTAGDDEFVVRLTTGVLEVLVNGVSNQYLAPAGLNIGLAINTGDMGGDDFLTVDNTSGLVVADITFDGGGETLSDGIRVVGLLSASAIYTPDAATSGDAVVTVVDGGSLQTIVTTDLEAVDFDTFGALTLVTAGSEDAVTLTTGRDAQTNSLDAVVISGTSDGVAFEDTHVRNVLSLVLDLAINDGGNADDTLTVTNGSLDAAPGLTSFTVQTGNGSDTFNINEDDFLLPGEAPAIAASTTVSIADATITETVPLFGPATGTSFAGAGATNLSGLVSADLDGDGDIDIAAVDSNTSQVFVGLNDGSGGFVIQTPIDLGVFQTTDLAVGEVTGDGFADLVVTSGNTGVGSGGVLVLTNDALAPGQNFTVGTPILTGAFNTSSIELADVTGTSFFGFPDGVLDIVAVNDNFTNGSISVFRNDGGGNFTLVQSIGGLSGPEDLVIGDFNGNFANDLAVVSNGVSAEVTVYPGQFFGGTFPFSPFDPTPFDTISVGAVNDNLTAIAAGNVDSTGRTDLVVLNGDFFNSSVVVLTNDGLGNPGSFTAGTPVPTGGIDAAELALADFNGDGDLDVAVVDRTDVENLYVATGIPGVGNAGFNAFSTFSSVNGSFAGTGIVAADFNGDGFNDVAQVGTGLETVSLFTNSAGSNVQVTISLSEPATQAETITYETVDGLALAGSDYTAVTNGSVTIAPGATSATVFIPILNNGAAEQNENFLVRLTGASTAIIVDQDAQVTILDDDGVLAGPVAGISNTGPFLEGDNGISFAEIDVTLTSAPAGAVNIDFSTRDITALDGFDYLATSGTLSFDAVNLTRRISVPIIGELFNEGAETFVIDFSSTDIILAESSTTVTIAASDTTLPLSTGITFDAGIGTDKLNVTTNAERIDLDATPGNEQIRLGSNAVPGTLGTLNLVGLTGEDVTVSGGAGDNTFDLSQWSNGARAVINGQGGDDAFVGLDVASNWTITTSNGGQVGDFTFNNIENLVGGDADDAFVFNGGSVTGSIDGGSGGVNSLTVGNTENTWTIERVAGGTVRLGSVVTDPQLPFDNLQEINGGTDTDTFEFAGGTIASLNGGTGEDVVIGGNLANTWNITDVNGDSMTVDEGTLTSALGVTTFSEIENLVGGDVGDTFVYDRNARISRTIDGGDGSANVLDLSGYSTILTANLSSIGTITGFAGAATGAFLPVGDAFDNITAINFNTLTSTIGDELVGLDANSQWDFGTSTYTTAGRSLDFVLGVTDDVTGGSSTDTFSFTGVNSASIRNVSGAGGVDTIAGNNVATSWTINGLNSGQLQPGVSGIGGFSDIENVVGGSNVDTFTFMNTGRLDGAIDGGAGADVIIGDTDGVQITITAGLSDSGTILEQDGLTAKVVGGFTSVENLTGAGFTDVFVINGTLGGAVNAGGGNDSISFGTGGTVAGVVDGGFGFDLLVGDDNANVFVITGSNSGTVTGKLSSFENVETLSGSGGDDSFTFADAGNINGQVIGGAGTDTVVGDEDGNIFSVTGANSGVLFGKNSAFSEIENLFGGAAADTFSVTGSLSGNIDGRADDDIFSFVAATTIGGTVTGGSGEDTFTLSGTVVGQVLGGTDNDTFNLNAGANIFAGGAGNTAGPNGVDGESGNDTFNVNGALTATIDGGADSDTVLGPNGATVMITGTGQGTIAPGPSGGFFNMDAIQGSAGSETIIIAGNFGGDLDTGGGDDNITIQNGGSVNNLNAGDGNDTVVVEDGAAVTGDIDLGDGNDSLNIADLATFDGIINGGTGDDIVTIDFSTGTPGQPRTITFNGDAGDDDLVVTGGGATATVDYTVGSTADSGTVATDLDGNNGTVNDRQTITFTGLEPVEDTQVATTFTINGSASNDTINVTDGNDGVGGLNEVNFNGAFELVRFSNKTTVEVNGLGGADTVNLNYTAGSASFAAMNVNAGTGGDTVNVLADHLGSVDGGDDSDQIVLSDGVSVSGTVGGGIGTDTLNYAAFTTDVAVNLQTLAATSINSGAAAGVSGFESLTGGSGSDSITAEDNVNAINVTGANAGNIDSVFSFSSVENLIGGSNDDSFNFSNGASVAGTVDGGTAGTDTLDYGSYLTAVSVNLQTSSATAINGGATAGFSNIDSVAGGTAADSITGPDADQTWTITSSEAGNVASVDFSEFEVLNGGSGDDNFAFNDGVALDFSINGGAETAADTVTFAASGSGVSVDVSLLTGIETLTGSGSSDTLVGTSGNDTFDVTGGNAGTVNTNTAFTTFENLSGAGGDDQFIFGVATSSISGDVDGQAGTDTLSYAGNPAGAANVTLTAIGTSGYNGVDGGAADVLNGFSNVDALIGTATSNDLIVGLDVVSTWTVTDTAGTTTGAYMATGGSSLSLSSFEALSGGSAADTFNVSSMPTASLNGQGGDDAFNFATDAAITGTIFGGQDDDTLSFAASSTDVTVTLTATNGVGGFDGTTGLASGGFESIDTVAGGAGDDTLEGRASATGTWTVDTTSTYVSGGETLEFSGIDNLTGSSAADIFNVNVSATIDIAAGDDADQFTVADGAVITGSFNGGAGADDFEFNGVITLPTLDGGTENDTVDLAGGSNAVNLSLDDAMNIESVIGTGQSDTLTGTASDDAFSVIDDNGIDNGTVNGVIFTSFENLAGAGGNDSFQFQNTLGLTGGIDGGADTDVIDYSQYSTSVTVNLSTGISTNIGGGISNIENAIGGQTDDSLTGSAGDNSLTGGLGDDVFFITDGGNDIVDDGLDSDTIDFSLATGPITIDLDSSAVQTVRTGQTVTLDADGIENFVGSSGDDVVQAGILGAAPRSIDGGGGSDRYETTSNGTNTWTINGPNAGQLEDANPVSFTSVENLTGGTDSDTFNFLDGGDITGTIDGNSNDDTVSFGEPGRTLAANLNIGQLVSIETLIGSGNVAGDTLTAADGGTDFVVSAANAGTAQNVGSVDVIQFSDFENLAGAAGDDSFTFNTGGSLASAVDGGGGSNSLVLNTGDDDITLSATSVTVGYSGEARDLTFGTLVTGFSNITSLDAGTGDNVLTGLDLTANWTIAAAGIYSTGTSPNERTLNYAGIDTVRGGSGADTFSFNENLAIVADGRGGVDTIEVSNATVELTAPITADGFSGDVGLASFDGINAVVGTSGTNTLQRDTGGGDATWTLNATSGNSYSEAGQTLTFSGMLNLIGGDASDTFNITGSNSVNITADGGDDVFNFLDNAAEITGTIDAGTGNDTLSFSGVTNGVTVDLAALTDFEMIIGGSGNDTLVGDGGNNQFQVTSAGAGVVTDLSVNFQNFETLQGAGGDDTFALTNGATIGRVDGQAGNDTIDLTAFTTARNVVLAGSASDGFNGTEAAVGTFAGITTVDLNGGVSGNSLSGLNNDSVWDLDATPTYTSSSRVLNFSGVGSIAGGSANDIFSVGTGGATLDVNGGAGDDELVIADQETLTGTFDGGEGFDTIDLSAYTTSTTFTVLDHGTDNGFMLSSTGLTGAADNADTVIGGSATDEVVGLNQQSAWSLSTIDDTVDQYFTQFTDPGTGEEFGRTLFASGIETRTGGSGIDTFTLQMDRLVPGVTHTVNGNSGNDVFFLEFNAGTSFNGTSNLVINGGDPSADIDNIDTVSIFVDKTGEIARSIGVTYDSAASGDVSVTGLGGASALDINTVETLEIVGDASNDDTVAVTTTATADSVTVVPAVNGGQVFLGGTTSTPGVAGGATGPDITISGVTNTAGISIDGAADADTLVYDGSPTVTPSGPGAGTLSSAGLVDVVYSSFETVDATGTLSFVIGATVNANDGTADAFNVAINAGLLEVNVNGSIVLQQDVSTIDQLVIEGSNDDDTLIVDYSSGNPVPVGGLIFNGNGQTVGDSLVVIGDGIGTGTSGTYTPSATTNGDGVVSLDGTTITFTGLEPVTISEITTFAFVTPNAVDIIVIDSPTGGENRVTGTSGGVTFESLNFSNVANFTLDAETNDVDSTSGDSIMFAADLLAANLASMSVNGGLGNDTIDASAVTAFGVSLNGGSGDDTIVTGGGNDLIDGGIGTDTVRQTADGAQTLTADTLLTGNGTDTLAGIDRADLIGGAGGDTISVAGFSGQATLSGQGGDDTLTGGAGNDSLDGGTGSDTVTETGAAGYVLTTSQLTGFGTDSLTAIENANLTGDANANSIDASGFTGTATTLSGAAGNDTITGSSGQDSIEGGDDDDSLQGASGNDTISGGTGNDLLLGGSGSDMLSGDADDDTVDGGSGNDTMNGEGGTDVVQASGSLNYTATDSQISDGTDTDAYFEFELLSIVGDSAANTIDASAVTIPTMLDGGFGNDTITGGSGTDSIFGNQGNDSIDGGDGDDTIDGGADNDMLVGGGGTDTLSVTANTTLTISATQTSGNGTDTFSEFEQAILTGGVGNNRLDASNATVDVTLLGLDGNDTLLGGGGNDLLDGGDGIDAAEFTGSNIVLTDGSIPGAGSDVTISLESLQLVADGAGSIIDASAYTLGPVTIIGSGGADTLRGGSGDDLILAGAGADIVEGGGGADNLMGSAGDDTMNGGEGIDSINGGSGRDLLIGDAGTDVLRGGGGSDTLQGGADDDTLFGDAGADTIFGEDGTDQLFGGSGNDGLNGGSGNDIVNGNSGNDTLLGSTGMDTLLGGSGRDTLVGGDDDDTVRGQGGADTMAGNGGSDKIESTSADTIDEAFNESLFPELLGL